MNTQKSHVIVKKQAMSPEAQRIAIAEACGWKKTIFGNWPTQMQRPNTDVDDVRTIPDHLSDLNAIHEAEKVLTPKQQRIYNDTLYAVANCDCHTESQQFAMCHSAAAQRAEAFLRTLNLWDDTK